MNQTVHLTLAHSAALVARNNAESAMRYIQEAGNAYDQGFADGKASVEKPAAYTTQEALRKVAGWVNSQQLPTDGPHAIEAATRRRLVVLLLDLASKDYFNYQNAKESLEGTQETP